MISRTLMLTVGAVLLLSAPVITWAAGQRTAGYWVRWSSCSDGNRAELASRNAGDADGDGDVDAWDRIATGWILLDDLLEHPGIVWDDGQDDGLVVRIVTCEQAVAILERRALDTDVSVDDDPAFTLAMQLLAAQLNLAAGAGSCPEADNAMLMAEDLLDTVDFDGTPPGAEGAAESARYLGPGDGPYEEALELTETLARYNRGQLCPK